MSMSPVDEDRIGLGADIGAACCLAVAEVVALIMIAGHYVVSGWSFDPAEPGRYGPVWGHLAMIAVVGALAVYVARRAARAGARVTAWGQGLMAGFAAMVVVVGALAQVDHDTGERPEPEQRPTGVVGCRSGGDSDECARFGG
ncbi:DUF6234 family protein [Thermomonospora amylolytica]|uniref:DUF6234 family protein n=1 Tax=Thermomonospora amylolytica TaxID=1411117 RepID=UPI001300941C|nr:DUF6234 family protein [Thermomonospora amylolytica]